MTFVEAFADAIAFAEGFYTPGSRAARNNNPGDLTEDLTGAGVSWDGPFVVYGTAADGWAALQKQVGKMLDGSSAFYHPGMSIREVAAKYTATEQAAWAANVAARLGVQVDSVIGGLWERWGSTGSGTVLVVALGALWLLRKGFR